MLKFARVGVVASSTVDCGGAGSDCGAVFGVDGDITLASFLCASENGILELTDRKFAAMVWLGCVGSVKLRDAKGEQRKTR